MSTAGTICKRCFKVKDVLCEPRVDGIDAASESVTHHINFCLEDTVPTGRLKCFSNYSAGITSDLKMLLNWRSQTFREGDNEFLRSVQRNEKARRSTGKNWRRHSSRIACKVCDQG